MNSFYVSLFLLCCTFFAQSSPPLRLNSDNTFKIVVFSSPRIGRSAYDDSQTKSSMRNILSLEKPNFVVLQGNLLEPEGPDLSDARIKKLWKELLSEVSGKYPYVTLIGRSKIAGISSRSLIDFAPDIDTSMNAISPKNESMFILNVLYSNGDGMASRLYFLDPTCDSAISSCISSSTVSWYQSKAQEFKDNNGGRQIPSMAFMTTTLPEMMEVYNSGQFLGAVDHSRGIVCQKHNYGLLSSFIDGKDIKSITFPAQRKTNFVGSHTGLMLAFGHNTGFDYEHVDSGARVYLLNFSVKQQTILYESQLEIETWIRKYDGKIEDFPSNMKAIPPKVLQLTCNSDLEAEDAIMTERYDFIFKIISYTGVFLFGCIFTQLPYVAIIKYLFCFCSSYSSERILPNTKTKTKHSKKSTPPNSASSRKGSFASHRGTVSQMEWP